MNQDIRFLVACMLIGAVLFAAIFSMTLIGRAPWSKKKGFGPIQFLGKKLSIEEVSIGLLFTLLGALWFVASCYFFITHWKSHPGHLRQPEIENILSFLTGLTLLFGGFSVLWQSRRWHGMYLSSVAVVLVSLGVAAIFGVPANSALSEVIFILGAITFALVGGLTGILYIMDRFQGRKGAGPRQSEKSDLSTLPHHHGSPRNPKGYRYDRHRRQSHRR